MKILIIGSGGREHAIAWKVKQDPRVQSIFVAPGNAGTASIAHNVPLSVTDIAGLLAWAQKEKPDYTIVGPEAPLCAGLVDAFEKASLPIFGPNQKGAQLEGSKIFTKNLLVKYGIPTAKAGSFTELSPAEDFSKNLGFPQVIKADGLAAGKGVLIVQNLSEAQEALHQILVDRQFGEAGNSVLIEEFLDGQEASIHAITDGKSYRILPSAQDHKRVGDGDTGLNTGGMGAYSPAPCVTPEILAIVKKTVFDPLLVAFQKEGIDYRGVLYAGLMLTSKGPKVLEFNARLGDPETEVLLPLLETSLIDVVDAVWKRTLDQIEFKVSPLHALTIVMAAPGYPENPKIGTEIQGLEFSEKGDTAVFHAGTKLASDKVTTSGGRVLAITAWAETLQKARDAAYQRIQSISFEGAHFRNDIGYRALRG
ncbi:MAG: phosphoribosylamine--glycine ligase [Verrucomicrobiota bacterium]